MLQHPLPQHAPAAHRSPASALHRHTDGERDQDDDGDEPGGVRHAGVSAHDDVMSDPILLLAGGSM